MNILNFLSNNSYVIYNKVIARKYGIEVALMVGELSAEYIYWKENSGLKNGWFYTTAENIEKNTALSTYQQNKALKILQKVNVVEVKVMGLPAKRHIRINDLELINFIESAEDFCAKNKSSNDNNTQNNTSDNKDQKQVLKNLKTEEIEGNFKNKNLKIKNTVFKNLKTSNQKFKTNNNKLKLINNINNNKESKKEGKNFENYEMIINKKIRNEKVKEAVYDFIKMRQFIKKPLTNKSLELILNDLIELSSEPEDQIKILHQSVKNSWVGVFSLNNCTSLNNNSAKKKTEENPQSEAVRLWVERSRREMIDELRRMGKLPNKPQEDDKEFQAFMNN